MTSTENNLPPAQAGEAALVQETGQYSFWKILGIWLAAGAPMWVLGWLVFPASSQGLPPADAGLLRLRLLTIGLVWQFILSMIIVYREEGNLRFSTIRRRFWLNNPISPKTGRKDNRLWWWLIPFLLLGFILAFAVSPAINDLWTGALPFLAEPPGYSMAAMFAPELRSTWTGAWDLFALVVVFALFNTVLGEEFIFRGVLLPKMNGVFGRWDWVANGVLFGLYHLHQPWGLLGNILNGLLYAFPSRRFRSSWFGIILHSAESVFLIFLILGLVLGLA